MQYPENYLHERKNLGYLNFTKRTVSNLYR